MYRVEAEKHGTRKAEHVCGMSGYNGMIDPPCPGCEVTRELLRPAQTIPITTPSQMADFRMANPKAPAQKYTLLPTDAQARKDTPVVTGVLDYFPLAIAYVAHV